MSDLRPFMETFELDEGAQAIVSVAGLADRKDAAAISAVIGNRSFNLGVFRIFSTRDVEQWNDIIGNAYPAFKGIVQCFGFGWDGRIIAETLADREDIERGVAIFNPGTAESLNAPIDPITFLNDDLGDDSEDLLDAARYLDWMKADKPIVGFDECIGYDVPLFAGGEDSFSNMSVIDVEVYWRITGPLIRKYLEANDGDAISL